MNRKFTPRAAGLELTRSAHTGVRFEFKLVQAGRLRFGGILRLPVMGEITQFSSRAAFGIGAWSPEQAQAVAR